MFAAVFFSHHGSLGVIRARRTHASPRRVATPRVEGLEFTRVVALARASAEADMTTCLCVRTRGTMARARHRPRGAVWVYGVLLRF